ncbi:MAG: hypothetical protein ACKVTZ_01925 [Bacteroidia bacterium]
MKITQIVIVITLFGISTLLHGQPKNLEKPSRRKNCISVDFPIDVNTWMEYASIGYERILLNRPKSFITGKLTASITGFDNSFSYNLGKKRNYLELGLGQHIGFNTVNLEPAPKIGNHSGGSINNLYFVYPIIGYRFQPLKKGLVLGVYLRPTRVENMDRWGTPGSGVTYTYSKIIHSWLAVKAGVSF